MANGMRPKAESSGKVRFAKRANKPSTAKNQTQKDIKDKL